MKSQVFLLCFICLVLFAYTLQNQKISISSLPADYYKTGRLSTTLLAHISKEFGAKMKFEKIIYELENKCKGVNFYDGLKIAMEKYDKGLKYFHKVEKTGKKIESKTENNKTEEIKLNNRLVKTTSDTLLSELLKCQFMSEKIEIAIRILLRKLTIPKTKYIEKFKKLLNKLSEILRNNSVNKVGELELSLVKKSKIEKLNRKIIIKIANLLGEFLKTEVHTIKKETENIISKKH